MKRLAERKGEGVASVLFAAKYGLVGPEELVLKAKEFQSNGKRQAFEALVKSCEETIRMVFQDYRIGYKAIDKDPSSPQPLDGCDAGEFGQFFDSLASFLHSETPEEAEFARLAKLANSQKLSYLKALLCGYALRHLDAVPSRTALFRETLRGLAEGEKDTHVSFYLHFSRRYLAYCGDGPSRASAAEPLSKGKGQNDESLLAVKELDASAVPKDGEGSLLGSTLLVLAESIRAIKAAADAWPVDQLYSEGLKGRSALGLNHLALPIIAKLASGDPEISSALAAEPGVRESAGFAALHAPLLRRRLTATREAGRSNAALLEALRWRYSAEAWFCLNLGLEKLARGDLASAFEALREAATLPDAAEAVSVFSFEPQGQKLESVFAPGAARGPAAQAALSALAVSQGKFEFALNIIAGQQKISPPFYSPEGSAVGVSGEAIGAFGAVVKAALREPATGGKFESSLSKPEGGDPADSSCSASMWDALRASVLASAGQFDSSLRCLLSFISASTQSGRSQIFPCMIEALNGCLTHLRRHGNSGVFTAGRAAAGEFLARVRSNLADSAPLAAACARLAAFFGLFAPEEYKSAGKAERGPTETFNAFLLGAEGKAFASNSARVALLKLAAGDPSPGLFAFAFNCFKDEPTGWLLASARALKAGNRALSRQMFEQARGVGADPLNRNKPALLAPLSAAVDPPAAATGRVDPSKVPRFLVEALDAGKFKVAAKAVAALWVDRAKAKDLDFFENGLWEIAGLLKENKRAEAAEAAFDALDPTSKLWLLGFVKRLVASVPSGIGNRFCKLADSVTKANLPHQLLHILRDLVSQPSNASTPQPLNLSTPYLALYAPQFSQLPLQKYRALRQETHPVIPSPALPSTDSNSILLNAISSLRSGASPLSTLKYGLMISPSKPIFRTLLSSQSTNAPTPQPANASTPQPPNPPTPQLSKVEALVSSIKPGVSTEDFEAEMSTLCLSNKSYYAILLWGLYRSGNLDSLEETLTKLTSLSLPARLESIVNYFVFLLKARILEALPAEEKCEVEEDLLEMLDYFFEGNSPELHAAVTFGFGIAKAFFAWPRDVSEGLKAVKLACLRSPDRYLPKLQAVVRKVEEFMI